MLTAERVSADIISTRTLYRLSEPTVTKGVTEPFEYLVLSLGRYGDTCVFPSNEHGNILDLWGFGFGVGPSRWLVDCEFDAYVQACIEQHIKDGGSGLTFAAENNEREETGDG